MDPQSVAPVGDKAGAIEILHDLQVLVRGKSERLGELYSRALGAKPWNHHKSHLSWVDRECEAFSVALRNHLPEVVAEAHRLIGKMGYEGLEFSLQPGEVEYNRLKRVFVGQEIGPVVGSEKDVAFSIGPPGFRAVVGALDVQYNTPRSTVLADCCSALRVAQVNALKLLKKALSSPANLRFEEACALARAFGFHLARVNGSHHIFARAGVSELLNLQEVDGKAKPYQVKQLLGLVERYNLSLGNEE
jgi:hypothetical protein